MAISRAAYLISKARLIGMRAELVDLMQVRGLPTSVDSINEINARIAELLPMINKLQAELQDC